MLSYDFAGVPADRRPAQVLAWNPDKLAAAKDSQQYERLSPFDPKAQSFRSVRAGANLPQISAVPSDERNHE